MVDVKGGQSVALLFAVRADAEPVRDVGRFVGQLLGLQLIEVGSPDGFVWFADDSGVAAPLTVRDASLNAGDALAEDIKAAERALGGPIAVIGAALTNRSNRVVSLAPVIWKQRAILLAVGKPQAKVWNYLPATVEGAKKELGEQASANLLMTAPVSSEDLETLAFAAKSSWAAVAKLPEIAANVMQQAANATNPKGGFPWGLALLGAGAAYAIWKWSQKP